MCSQRHKSLVFIQPNIAQVQLLLVYVYSIFALYLVITCISDFFFNFQGINEFYHWAIIKITSIKSIEKSISL